MVEGLHPIVAQLTPNPEQLPAIRARGGDVVVTAGAGTGKTRTLVARYLSLLAEGKPLRSIVAITFTRKAAREMRNRVRAEVRRYVAHGELGPRERERWQAAYAGLDAARIGTIHSLCAEMMHAHPAEALVDPRFGVLEEAQATLLRRQVLDDALAWAADDPDGVRLFEILEGPERLRAILEALMGQRLDARRAFDAAPGEPLSHWREVLIEEQRRRLRVLLSEPAWTEAVSTLQRSRPIEADDAMALGRRLALQAIDGGTEIDGDRIGRDEPGQVRQTASDRDIGRRHEIREQLEARLAGLSRLDAISLGGGSYKAWPGGKAEKAAVKDALRALRQLWREHADLLSLELNPLDETLAEAMPGLRAVFQFACQRYQSKKRDERVLDFDDLEHGAVELLQAYPEVKARWQREVEAILVDEFQDTNERQRRLVRLLGANAGTLFIVGDAKQSIYGFRGADVTVFRAERERIAGREGLGYSLETSYRAHRGLVRDLNALLKPVLGEKDDPHRPWAEPFAPIAPHREDPGPGIEAPYAEFHLAVGSKGAGALDRAARALCGRLGELVDTGAQVMDDEGLRPLRYGDMAILCRASSSFSYYEDALDEAGVPYVTVAGRGFYDRPEIRDLLNALRALSDPTDDLALVGLLRSPAVGLSDAAIYELVRAREKAPGPLWNTLQEGGVGFDPVAERRATRAVGLVKELHTMAGRTAVGDLLKDYLDATSYRAALLRAGQQRAVRNVNKLLNAARESRLVGVGAFVEYVGSVQDSGAREGEARSLSGGAVQIMSVHQAKGLEFPIVVLGDATWGGGGGRGVITDPELGVLLPLKDPDDERAATYRLARAREQDQAAAESDRLLYVAATRAQEKLLVSGHFSGIRKDGTPYKLGGWLGKLGRPLGLHEIELDYDEQGGRVHYRELRGDGTRVGCFIYEPHCTTYQPTAGPTVDEQGTTDIPIMPPPLLGPLPQVGRKAREGETRQLVGRVVPEGKQARAPSRVVGDLVHEALAAWRLPSSMDDAALRPWLQARARAAGLFDAQQIANARRRSERLLLRFRRSSLFERVVSAQRRLHEVPYALHQQGRLDSGAIDLLYRREGRWTLVEFKTDEVRSQAAFEGLLRREDYLAQVQRYGAAATRLLGTRPTSLLVMLDYEHRMRVYSVPKSGPPKRIHV